MLPDCNNTKREHIDCLHSTSYTFDLTRIFWDDEDSFSIPRVLVLLFELFLSFFDIHKHLSNNSIFLGFSRIFLVSMIYTFSKIVRD